MTKMITKLSARDIEKNSKGTQNLAKSITLE